LALSSLYLTDRYFIFNILPLFQVRRNVWLELVPRKAGNNSSSRTTQRLLPKAGGVIGVANCIMNATYIDNMFHPSQEKQSLSSSDLIKEEKKVQILKKEKEPPQKLRANDTNSEDPYAAMMFKIDMDIISTGGSDPQRNQLLSRTFRGLVADEQVVMGPGAEVEMNLFIVDGDEGQKKSGVRLGPPRKDYKKCVIYYRYDIHYFKISGFLTVPNQSCGSASFSCQLIFFLSKTLFNTFLRHSDCTKYRT
jgi:hypothetical protein